MEVVVGVPIGDMEGDRIETEGIMGEAVILGEVATPKTNPETCHAEYPQSVSARADTQYESPHSPPAGY